MTNNKQVGSNILKAKRSNSPTFSENTYTWPNVPKPTQFEILICYNTISAMLAITQSNARIYENSEFKWDKKALKFAKWTASKDSKY